MTLLRHRLMRRRVLAAWLVAATLLLKMLVPAGYMIDGAAGSITIRLCSGYAPRTMAAPMPGMAHHPEREADHGAVEMPCAFAGLATPSLAGADALPLAEAAPASFRALFQVLVATAAVAPPPHLRPPSRGPPHSA